MVSLEQWLNSSLNKIDHEYFQNVVHISVESNPMADGQMVIISDINRVDLTLSTSDGKKKTMRAVSKVEPSTRAGQILAQQTDVFQNEIMMYGDVLKTMEKLMAENGDRNYLWPECYHCANNKLLLQDLCEIGYKVVPTHQFLNFDHTVLAMRAIGKFHALSMAMEERSMLDHTKLKPSELSQKISFTANLHRYCVGNLVKVMETWGSEWSEAAKRLSKLIENPGDSMYNWVTSTKGKWDVLTHGDYTMRNILFHYSSDSNTPNDIKFVDFQNCSFINLGLDLSTLLYTSTKPKLRDDNMDEFLSAYVESMTETCNKYNYKGNVPTLEDVRACLKGASYLSSVSSICAVPFFILSGKQDTQREGDDLMENCVGEKLNESSEKKDLYFSDPEVIDIMKYEVKRLIRENII